MNSILGAALLGMVGAGLLALPQPSTFVDEICRSPILASMADGLVSADPRPNEDTWIYDNQISMVFDQKITAHSVVVTDSEGCTVSQSDEVVGNDDKIVVHMKACKRSGYPGGHMTVKYTVNGTAGEYHLHIRHHH